MKLKSFKLVNSVLVCLFCCVAFVAADDEPLEAKSFKGKKGGTLLYRWMQPNKITKKKKYPLVIFLHGAGERGADNQAQLKHCVRKFAEPDMRKKFPCYVIAPQCPKDKRWVEVHWGDKVPHTTPSEPSQSMGLLLELLPKLIKKNAIDKNRIYVMGLSMGGYGTWDLMVRLPDEIAAAVPICGGADNSKAKLIAHIPVWAWHGDKDTIVPTIRTQSMIKALKNAGGKPKYTELPGVSHFAWPHAFGHKKMFIWMFAQKLDKK